MSAEALLDFATGATAPAAIVRSHSLPSSAAAFPPTTEELAKSLVRDAGTSATAPNRQAQTMFLLYLSEDGRQQIVIPLIQVKEDIASINVEHSLPLSDRLDQIKERLSLSVTQLAELFNVTRKSVYDWYEGAEPRPATNTRIAILSAVLREESPDVALQQLKTAWNVPVSGQSFHALLNDDSVAPADLKKALSEKLHELSSQMVRSSNQITTSSAYIGSAHASEFDRRADIG